MKNILILLLAILIYVIIDANLNYKETYKAHYEVAQVTDYVTDSNGNFEHTTKLLIVDSIWWDNKGNVHVKYIGTVQPGPAKLK